MKINCDFISDAKIKRLYQNLRRGGEWDLAILDAGGELLDTTTSDPVAVLQAMKIAVSDILDDLQEHGDENRALYNDLPDEHFTGVLVQLTEELQSLLSKGQTSEIFEEYERRKRQVDLESIRDTLTTMYDRYSWLTADLYQQILRDAKLGDPPYIGDVMKIVDDYRQKPASAKEAEDAARATAQGLLDSVDLSKGVRGMFKKQ
jgi:hypothetical protein